MLRASECRVEDLRAIVAETTLAADYPLDYTSLLGKYEADVVEHCCATFERQDAHQTCGAPTKKGVPCGRRAVANGVCSQHLAAWERQQEAQRQHDAYATARQRDGLRDLYAQELKEVGKKRQVSTAFPADVGDVLRDLSKRRAV